MKKGIYALLMGLLVLASCVNPPDYPVEPTLEFISNSKLELIQGNTFPPNDTIEIVLGFTDGDGDIGHGSDEVAINLSLVDSRTGLETQTFKVPQVPNANEKYGISGEIILSIYSVCCQHPELNQICKVWDDFPVDEFYYEVTLTDRAGNKSNTVRTDAIRLLCE